MEVPLRPGIDGGQKSAQAFIANHAYRAFHAASSTMTASDVQLQVQHQHQQQYQLQLQLQQPLYNPPTEIDRLWNLLAELSSQLSNNRQQTEDLHRRAEELRVGNIGPVAVVYLN